MIEEPKFRNPFRSEADAFRLLVIVGVAVLAIAAAAALGGRWVGAAVAAVLIGAGCRATYRWARLALAAPAEGETGSDQDSGPAVR